jgi:hypothetical protein
MDQPRPGNDNRTMRETTAEFEDGYIASVRGRVNLSSIAHNSVNIALSIAVQVPIGRIEWHLDTWNQAYGLIDLGK